jgi:hypothetical protein
MICSLSDDAAICVTIWGMDVIMLNVRFSTVRIRRTFCVELRMSRQEVGLVKRMAMIRFWQGLVEALAIKGLLHLVDRASWKFFLQSICTKKRDYLVVFVHDMDNVFTKNRSAY